MTPGMEDPLPQALAQLLLQAAMAVCPQEVSLLNHKKNGVRRAQSTGQVGDYSTSFARAAFLRMLGTRRQQRRTQQSSGAGAPGEGDAADDEGEDDPAGVVTVRVVTDLGAEVVRQYASAEELAHALAAALPEDDAQRLVADVRVREGGILSLCTVRYIERQRVRGFLRCDACGEFCSGDRGLRDHSHVKHAGTYAQAKANVALHASQLVVYTTDRSLLAAWEGEAASERRARDQLGDPGLEAARAGELQELRTLVAGGWDCHRAADKHGSNALMWAAGNGHLEVCKYLCGACGLPAVLLGGPTHKRRRNALHWAARNGHLNVVKWLVLEEAVPVDIGTSDGTTAFMYAVWQGHQSVVKWLARPASPTRATTSDEGGAARCEEAEPGGGCEVGARNDFGCNAIQWCVQTGDVPMCELLVALGLDITISNKNGHSALHKAAVKGQRQACEWLIGLGGLALAQMAPDRDGNTPADIARLEGHAGLAAWLEEQQQQQQQQQEEEGGQEDHEEDAQEDGTRDFDQEAGGELE